MSLTIIFIVAVTAAVHALFDVGLLLFGTPVLLLLGYDYLTILHWLLPIALMINLLHVWFYASRVDWAFVRTCKLFILPGVIACSPVMAHFDLAIGPIVGVLLILAAVQRLSSSADRALSHVMRHTALFCVVMGAVQGLTSLGGSLLSALIHSKAYDKDRARHDSRDLRHIPGRPTVLTVERHPLRHCAHRLPPAVGRYRIGHLRAGGADTLCRTRPGSTSRHSRGFSLRLRPPASGGNHSFVLNTRHPTAERHTPLARDHGIRYPADIAASCIDLSWRNPCR